MGGPKFFNGPIHVECVESIKFIWINLPKHVENIYGHLNSFKYEELSTNMNIFSVILIFVIAKRELPENRSF